MFSRVVPCLVLFGDAILIHADWCVSKGEEEEDCLLVSMDINKVYINKVYIQVSKLLRKNCCCTANRNSGLMVVLEETSSSPQKKRINPLGTMNIHSAIYHGFSFQDTLPWTKVVVKEKH